MPSINENMTIYRLICITISVLQIEVYDTNNLLFGGNAI